jgi:type II secretory pathway component PulK
MCTEGNNYIAPKWAREEREINSGSTTETLNNYTTSNGIQQYFNINSTTQNTDQSTGYQKKVQITLLDHL